MEGKGSVKWKAKKEDEEIGSERKRRKVAVRSTIEAA